MCTASPSYPLFFHSANWYADDPAFAVLYDDADGDGFRDFGDRTIFTRPKHGAKSPL